MVSICATAETQASVISSLATDVGWSNSCSCTQSVHFNPLKTSKKELLHMSNHRHFDTFQQDFSPDDLTVPPLLKICDVRNADFCQHLVERKILEVKKDTLNILLVFCSHIIIWKISRMIPEDKEEFVMLFLLCLPENSRSNEQNYVKDYTCKLYSNL